MVVRSLLALAFVASTAVAQKICNPTPAYSRCEIVFELSPEERRIHPNPYMTVRIGAEIRSPRHRTVQLPAFWNGEAMIVRFAPNEVGDWDVRFTSNLPRYDNKEDKISATPSEDRGFIQPANGHHWMWTETRKAHLWMGFTEYELAGMSRADSEALAAQRSEQKFNHVRTFALPAKPNPDSPDLAFYRALDKRVALLNSKGILCDLILGRPNNQLAASFPNWQQRDRFLRYLIARYSAFNITWEVLQEFESYETGRDLAKELGTLLKSADPYQHPRSAHAQITSAPLLADEWMTHTLYHSSDTQLGLLEHQMYSVPAVNTDVAAKAGKDDFRHAFWNSVMNGQYPVLANAGQDAPENIRAMRVWFDFMQGNRYWELEPYFELDGCRAIALRHVEYIAYVEKPSGPIEVRMEKHGYDVRWIDPATGEVTPVKDFKSDKFVGEPPDRTHDWILHISREGHKESMKSYKFESRRFEQFEVDTSAAKVPYSITNPTGDELAASKPHPYGVKLKRETRGTRTMMYLWTGEVATEGQGYRVLGTGANGTLTFPKNFTSKLPAVVNVRVYGMNANGALYSADRIFRIVP